MVYNQDKLAAVKQSDRSLFSQPFEAARNGALSTNSSTKRHLSNPHFADNKTYPVHRWVNWIAGFSWKFAGEVIDRYIPPGTDRSKEIVLDPFAGVGTTLIEAQRRRIPTIGFEINPFAHLAARAKLEAVLVEPSAFRDQVNKYVSDLSCTEKIIDQSELEDVPLPKRQPPRGFRSRVPFFSPKVERKVLLTLDYIDEISDIPTADLFRLAFATTMVSFSNYTYEPSLGSRPGAGKPLQDNAPVVPTIAAKLLQMTEDIASYRTELGDFDVVSNFDVRLQSFFDGSKDLDNDSVSLVVTSPPYLNNYHYIRNTRPHLFWLGYVSSPDQLSTYEHQNFGKFWQTVRDGEPVPLAFEMPILAEQIEQLRGLNIHKGVYGGGGWANYAATYFNDSNRFVRELARVLKPGGTAVIVVGNNVLQGMEFKVDEELANIAHQVGLKGRSDIVRLQRVGSSIMGTGSRQKVGHRIELYEAAVTIQKE